VNKADREGADRVVSQVEANLALRAYGPEEWRPPILKTTATTGAGVAELVAAIWTFRERSAQTGRAPGTILADRQRSRIEYRLRELVAQRFMHRLEREVLAPTELASVVERIAARELDPYTAANELLARALGTRTE
jgi:GTPase